MGILILINITACLALIDIALKSTIEGYMTQKEERTACGGKLILRKVYNKGMCMNLLEDHQEVVKYGSAFAAVLLTIYQLITLLRRKACILKKWGLSLMTAGAWSNTFDRWVRGYVIDYAAVKCRHEKLSKITFNLGDVLIGIGGIFVVIAAVIAQLRGKKK